MASQTSKRQPASSSVGSFSLASPSSVFAALLAISFGLLWVTPQDAKPIQNGVRWALSPGVRAVEWTERQTTKMVRYARRELPSSETLGRNQPGEETLR